MSKWPVGGQGCVSVHLPRHKGASGSLDDDSLYSLTYAAAVNPGVPGVSSFIQLRKQFFIVESREGPNILSQDARKHARFSTRLRCWCEGENVTVYARIGNISEGGLFLRTSTPLAPGSNATVRFGVEAPIEASAVVVWCKKGENGGPSGMGLKFNEIDQLRLAELRKLIQSEQVATKP